MIESPFFEKKIVRVPFFYFLLRNCASPSLEALAAFGCTVLSSINKKSELNMVCHLVRLAQQA